MQFFQQLLTLIVDLTIAAFIGLVVLFAIAKARSEKSSTQSPSTTVKAKREPSPVKTQEPAPAAEAPTATPQPSTPVAESPKKLLAEQLVAKGKSAQTTDLLESLAYKNHPDSEIRKLVAATLGKIAGTKKLGWQMQPTISVLGELSRDADASVRQSAAIALGKIGSQQAIPFLKRALRDTDPDVVKSASAAIGRFKNRPAHAQSQKPLPKNDFIKARSLCSK
jgi:type IV secretory pathway VirB10-like protein